MLDWRGLLAVITSIDCCVADLVRAGDNPVYILVAAIPSVLIIVLTADKCTLFDIIYHLHLQVVQHLGALELGLYKLFWQDHMTQVSHKICVNPHLDKLGL